MSNEQAEPGTETETSDFTQSIKERHRDLINRYNRFRKTVSGILLLNTTQAEQQYSREELIKRKSKIRSQINQHIEAVQSIMLPALSGPDDDTSTSVNVLATVQNRLQELLGATNEHFNGLLDQTSTEKDRREVARKVLLDMFRLDSLLKVYLETVETHYVPLGDRQLDDDEKEEIIRAMAELT